MPRGLWGSICGQQQRQLLRVLRGYGWCRPRGFCAGPSAKGEDVFARRWCGQPEEFICTGCDGVDVVSVVAPDCGAHAGGVPVGKCDCWQACGSRGGGIIRRPAAKSVRDADPAWQLSCLEYGLVEHADGRLACVDGSVLFDAPSMLLE